MIARRPTRGRQGSVRRGQILWPLLERSPLAIFMCDFITHGPVSARLFVKG